MTAAVKARTLFGRSSTQIGQDLPVLPRFSPLRVATEGCQEALPLQATTAAQIADSPLEPSALARELHPPGEDAAEEEGCIKTQQPARPIVLRNFNFAKPAGAESVTTLLPLSRYAAGARRRRVLITGASGLLGREALKVFEAGDWEVRGLCLTREAPGLVRCDLGKEGAAAEQINEFRPHVVVNLATESRPEALQQNLEGALRINVHAPQYLAIACQAVGARLVHLSTDAVFDGQAPPYNPDSKVNPITDFGWQKSMGERLALSGDSQVTVLRVPLLFGDDLENEAPHSTVGTLHRSILEGAEQTGFANEAPDAAPEAVLEVDDWQLLYPTFAADVAGVLKLLVEACCSPNHVDGIYHWSGPDGFTRYEMACVIAKACGLSLDFLRPRRRAPCSPVARDTQLDITLLARTLKLRDGELRTPFENALRQDGLRLVRHSQR